MKFEELRNTYPKFIYHNYQINEDDEKIVLTYHFEIENLAEFHPKIEILKKQFSFKSIQTNLVKNMVFHLGMIEAISYFKATCSPQFVIKCGKLDTFQEKWFQKLFFLGTGEFRYINQITVPQEQFVKWICQGQAVKIEEAEKDLEGLLIPVGGGKDSNVTLDILKPYKDKTVVFHIGNQQVPIQCAKIAGFQDDDILEVRRIIDKNLLALNEKGFLNGHTPFSAMVAFLTYLVSYLLGKKYVVLSNEDSANETNVQGENINHQYSKTLEFENDFREYAQKYLCAGVEYFSFLRPITELQITALFSKLEQYHLVFKSCNVGSKQEEWKWCCHCPKCLFVYIMLSPFLEKKKLINIFGEDLFERKDLLKTFIELCGYGKIKPFECVGTFREIQYALTQTIQKQRGTLPYLLAYYKEHFPLSHENILTDYHRNHHIPEEFEKLLKERLEDIVC